MRQGSAPIEEASNLLFSHAVHLDAAGVKHPQKGRVKLACDSCHHPDASRRGFEPVSMRRDCQDCHRLEFEPAVSSRQVPHAAPGEAVTVVREFYANLALNGTRDSFEKAFGVPGVGLLRRAGEPSDSERRSALALAEGKSARIARELFGNRLAASGRKSEQVSDELFEVRVCRTCHEVVQEAGKGSRHGPWPRSCRTAAGCLTHASTIEAMRRRSAPTVMTFPGPSAAPTSRCRRSSAAANATAVPGPWRRRSRPTACSATVSTSSSTPGTRSSSRSPPRASRRGRSLRTEGQWFAAVAIGIAIAGCSGSSGNAGSNACVPNCNAPANLLQEEDVRRVIAQATGEAQARGARATIAVVDRVGNVLAVFQMSGARVGFDILSGRAVAGGLDGIRDALPATAAAIAKAITGAYLSSSGNAFSSRTASQIVQQNFLPGESNAPSGPLYGVQFSQLSCSDVMRNATHGSVGPKRSPLGLAADPGGLPLYKNGAVVGGIGVMADGVYGLDPVITDIDEDLDELIAVAGGWGFAPPADIRAERITADGKTFRYVDSESLASDPSRARARSRPCRCALVAVAGYAPASVRAGVAFGTPASGYRAATGPLASVGAFTLVDGANAERYPARGTTLAGGPTAAEVSRILEEGIRVANRSRAQIRRPLGSAAEVSVVVVDLEGEVLGLARTPDAPIFGTDVAVQKARGALLFSRPDAASLISGLPAAAYLSPAGATSSLAAYVSAMRAFVGDGGALDGRIAWSMRAIGNLHRPTFPDGVGGTPPGPLSKGFDTWSPFNVGFQLDLVYNQLVKAVAKDDITQGCAGRAAFDAAPGVPDAGLPLVRNGIQIFPGGMPLYRNGVLVGAVGVSGDGVDQDDMVALLGVSIASRALGTGLGHAAAAMRADTLAPLGVRLRYAQCPQSPFNDSTEQNACEGL